MKKNILLLQGLIPDYREPIFNLLAEKYNLTIGYTLHTSEKKPKFKSYKVSHYKFKNIFLPTYEFLKSLLNYDLIIIMPDLHYFNYCIVPFLPIKSKVVSFSIGFRASYKNLYDVNREKKFLDFVFLQILKKCDANIFYYKYPLDFWGNLLARENIYFANNTIEVLDIIPNKAKKKSIVFLGSLIEGKGILELINAYKTALIKNDNVIPPLKIVGEGPLLNKIIDFIKKNQLTSRVFILGGIYEEEDLKNLFEESIYCISPNQAGLSVLKSFGYGVPFITKTNAITGGERLNILNGYNGILFESFDDLVDIIRHTQENVDYFYKMGLRAKKYYNENTTLSIMKEGFVNAIENTLK